jgi:UDP-N-acetylmuramoyl-tripeptide--D-alanyl-D-alanine ligase
VKERTITLGWAAESIGATWAGAPADTVIREVVTDSRLSQPGDLFVALRGPRFDGHAFVADAFGRGTVGAIVERGRGGGDTRVLEVADTLLALQRLAHAVRASVETRVVAITGSAGKTTTKDAIAALLATRFRVVKNEGNLNNHIGLPLALLQVRSGPDVAVMELGMNHAGEIRRLVEIAEPDVRVWLNVGDAHLGFFSSVEGIADAKAEVLERATEETVLVCNADDPRVMARVGMFPGRRLTFGRSADAAVRVLAVEDRGVDGTCAEVSTPAGRTMLDTSLLGRGNLANVLAATTVALEFGLSLDTVAAEVGRFRAADRRGVVRQLRRGITLIDDSYNCSPSALEGALDVLAHEAPARRTIGVIGEMLELGAHASRLHEACGRAAHAAGLSRLFVIGGPGALSLAAGAIAAGMRPAAVSHFDRSDQAGPGVVSALEAGDLVLVKGSRGIRTDLVADHLLAELG